MAFSSPEKAWLREANKFAGRACAIMGVTLCGRSHTIELKFLSTEGCTESSLSNAMDEEDHELVFTDASKKKRSRLATCACVSGIGGAVFCFLTTVGLA